MGSKKGWAPTGERAVSRNCAGFRACRPPERVRVILEGMLYLASQSPRRRELLARLGQPFASLDIDVPEQRQPGEPPEDYVRRVAREKAGAGLLQVMAIPGARVIGADTEVVLDDDVFGNTIDRSEERRVGK